MRTIHTIKPDPSGYSVEEGPRDRYEFEFYHSLGGRITIRPWKKDARIPSCPMTLTRKQAEGLSLWLIEVLQ